MGKVTTLQDRAREIIRRYKKINTHRFVYNDKKDLRTSYTHIKCWFLIHDTERGYSVFPFTFKRKKALTVPQWTKLFKKALGKYQPLMAIFTQAVLPAINNKGGNSWRFKALLCWTGITLKSGDDALQEAKNTAEHRRGNKTPNKRASNERNRNRRR